MKTAYSYIRMSTPQQLRGDSLRRQLQSSRLWCEKNGYELDDSLRDIGISAFHGLNKLTGSLGKFIELAKSGKIESGSVLLLESLDRLSRQEVLESLGTFTEILATGVEIVTLADNQRYTSQNLNNIGNLIISLVILSRAHEESKIKSERMAASWANKRKNALKKPVTAIMPAWLRLDKKTNCINEIPERVLIVREIFEKTIAGYGRQKLVSYLNEQKIETWGRSKFWQPSYISKILDNRAVLGEYQPHRGSGSDRTPAGDAIKNYYPAVIDELTFYRAKNARSARKNQGGRRGRKFSNLFTGLLFCMHCNSSMAYIDKCSKKSGKNGGRRLVCSGYRNRSGCSNNIHYIYDHVEHIFLQQFAHEFRWHDLLLSDTSETKKTGEKIDALTAQIEEQKKYIDELRLIVNASRNKPAAVREICRADYLTGAEKLVELETELEAAKQKTVDTVSNHDFSTALKNVLLLNTDDDDKYAARAALNQILKKYIDKIEFNLDYTILCQMKNGDDYLLTTNKLDFNSTAELSFDFSKMLLNPEE
ncbi:MAG: recombinase family protein [Gammaproteobacteria bacterium]|nr:recombinase family protein [Gammaproteobacteria bacterium]